jgi:hypothetical protein
MVTVLEECITEEQRFVLFCGKKDSIQRIFIKKYFLFTVGSVYRVRRFTTGSRNVANFSLMTKRLKQRCGKWLRQHSKDFCAAGFAAFVKRWDKYIKVGGGYIEK